MNLKKLIPIPIDLVGISIYNSN